MQNPLFLILIVRRNQDNFSKDLTQSLFNENGNSDRKRADVASTNSDNPNSAPYHSNDAHSEMDKQKGNRHSK
jgi:hypothetical protein